METALTIVQALNAFVFVVLGLLALVFVYTSVPETRGRSLEDLEDQFRTQYS